MAYLPHLVALAGIWTLVVLSPGPDFVVTVSRAATSRRAGLAAAAGIVLSTAVWASASAAGLELVLAHYRWVAEVVRLLGAGYLTWLGVRLIVRARQPVPARNAAAVSATSAGAERHASTGTHDGARIQGSTVGPGSAVGPGSTAAHGITGTGVHGSTAVAENAGDPGAPRLGPSFRAGLLADLGNPKAAVFWTSLFAAVLPPTGPVWVRVCAVGVAVVISAAWYSAVACAFSLAAITRNYRRAKTWIDRVTGGVLVGLAARLAAEH
jgi:threonine efflux protein